MSDPDTQQFLPLPSPGLKAADAVILPLPFERTVSYGKGTAGGPRAILEAGVQVEVFDEELLVDFQERPRVHTVPPLEAGGRDVQDYLEAVRRRVAELRGPFLLALGGEHLVTWGVVRGIVDDPAALTVVHIDAHADLRDELGGLRWSHGTVMRRVRELGCPLVQVGIRALSRAEYKLSHTDGQVRTFFAHELPERWDEMAAALRALRGDVFLSFDIDGLDPSVVPSTGTPMPNGLSWREAMAVLRALAEAPACRWIGADLVEFVPSPKPPGCDIIAAQLAEKILAHWAVHRGFQVRG